MDNTQNNLDPVSATAAMGGKVITNGQTLVSSTANIAKGIRDKAKAKSAQKTADAGQYWTLRPYLKSLIPIPDYIIKQVAGQGITEYAVLQLPEQSAGSSNTQIISALKQLSGSGSGAGQTVNPTGNILATDETVQEGFDFKKYLPYIAGIVIIGLIIYFVTKK